MPGQAAALDHAVASLGQIPAHGLRKRLTTADTPPDRPVELRHARRQNLKCHTILTRSHTRQAHQVLRKAHPAKFRQGTDPHHPIDRNRHRAVADLPFGQVHVADDATIDFGQDALIGSIHRVGERTQERLAIGSMKNMQQGLVDRFMIGFGARQYSTEPRRKGSRFPGAGAFIRSTMVETRREARPSALVLGSSTRVIKPRFVFIVRALKAVCLKKTATARFFMIR